MLRSFNFRCHLLFLLTTTGFSILAYRLIEIQYFDRIQFQAESTNNKETYTHLHGGRGRIVDRDNQTIARSITKGNLSLYAPHYSERESALNTLAWAQCCTMPKWDTMPEKLKKQERRKVTSQLRIQYENNAYELEERYLAYAVDHVATALTMRRSDLVSIIKANDPGKNDYFLICKDLDEETCDQLQEVLETKKIQGFEITKSARRQNPAKEFAVHIIGRTKLEVDEANPRKLEREVGANGLEAGLEKKLAGKDGHRICITNPSGDLIGKKSATIKPPLHGGNVMLTLDTPIQNILQEELSRAIHEFQATLGCIIVMEPNTGEILGIANHSLDKSKCHNFAVQMIYEPGSTIKAIAFAAALNEGLINRQTPIDCHNGLFERGKLVIDESDRPFGTLSAEWVMGHSSNIGTFMIAEKYGMLKHYEYLTKFGFGKPTEIELTGELRGRYVPSNNETEFASKTYGYNISVTPLQMACAYSVIANGGKLLKPRLLKAVIASNGDVKEETQPKFVRQVISPYAASETRIGLATVITKKGTAKLAIVPGHTACGKTGTAKKYDAIKNKYSDNSYTCSFAGMLPANNPQIVCVVVIDNPQPTTDVKIGGGTIAAPVFSRVCSRVAEHLRIAPTVAIDPHVANQ